MRSALEARYYRPVPASVLGLGSVHEIIRALGDPYTTYLGPATYQLVRQTGPISDRTVGVEFLDGGVEAYCFTFG